MNGSLDTWDLYVAFRMFSWYFFSSWWTSRQGQEWITDPLNYFSGVWTIAALSLGFTEMCDCHLSHIPSPDGKCCRGRCLCSCDKMWITPISWADMTEFPLLPSVSARFVRQCSARGCAAAAWLRLLRELRTEPLGRWHPGTPRAQSCVPSKVAFHWCVMSFVRIC